MGECARVPLTLTLSHREREPIVLSVEFCVGFLPLPVGEGRGEGSANNSLLNQIANRWPILLNIQHGVAVVAGV